MSNQTSARTGVVVIAVLICVTFSRFGHAAPDAGNQSELIGVWRGTSACSDRVAAPACKDEVVVYEFTAGEKPGTVHWQADKVVDGERQSMGGFDLAYDKEEACWKAEFRTPRVHLVWRLVVDGVHMTGTGQFLPGKETVRKINVRKD
jgi:hypothetical protein